MLRTSATEALKGVNQIIHAGDVGSREVLEALEAIAPVTAVRGNMDGGGYAKHLNPVEVVEAENISIYILHDLNQLDLDPVAAGFQVVVFGHSHRPAAMEKNGVLYLNPGSAGPRRFTLPVSLNIMTVQNGHFEHRFIQLEV
jgi:putative phosphoesterase